MDYRLLYPSLYIGAADLKGMERTLTIRRVVVEELKTDRGSERKPVLYFVETETKGGDPTKERRMVLNKTNAKTIAKMYAENEIENWIGKRITLYPTTTSVAGEQRDCIRIRATIPAEKEPADVR